MERENLVSPLDVNWQVQQSGWLNFLIVLLALLLNQSKVIAQVNLSFSDLLMVLIIIWLFFKGMLVFPQKISLFFLTIIILTMTTAVLWVPLRLGLQAPVLSVIANVVKLVTVFLYFFMGYSLTQAGQLHQVLKWFALGSAAIAILAVMYSLLPGLPLRSWLYFGGTRYSGLMNDPNYFAVIQCSALAYFLFKQHFRVLVRWFAGLMIIFSILVTGSKTGMITLAVMLLLKLLDWLSNNSGGVLKIYGLVGLGVLGLVILVNLQLIVNFVSRYVPEFERVAGLLTNFGAALHAEGSTRDLAWGNAVKLIEASPLLGIGVGTYSFLAEHFYGTRVIAHNTYLQLLVEWGVPLASFSFGYLFWLIGKSLWNQVKLKQVQFVNLMIVPFLIGSFALSLNNARIFWILFGAIFYYVGHSYGQNRVEILNGGR